MLERLAAICWGPWTMALFLAVGGYYSWISGFFQIRGIRHWLKATLGGLLPSGNRGRDGLSPVQTMSTALAATLGTGSIAGVATAITFGGPGAIFWMWLTALLSMMTGFGEKALSILIRRKRPDGSWEGGPMVWLEELGLPGLARCFAMFTLLASLSMGNLVQANSISAALQASFGLPPLASGVILAVFSALPLLGGIQSVGRVCEKLVPAMALLFLGGCIAALWVLRANVLRALGMIISSALSPAAAAGGGLGAAVRWGVARGVCTNEAGLGSTPMIHACSANTDPVQEGMWGILEVFFSTLVVCTLSALVIMSSGLWQDETQTGAALSAAAWELALGKWGCWLLALCLTLFAFSTLLGWSWYGCCGARYLAGEKGAEFYRIVFLGVIVVGSLMEVRPAWLLSDIFNAGMAIPTLLALLLWAKEIRELFCGRDPRLTLRR